MFESFILKQLMELLEEALKFHQLLGTNFKSTNFFHVSNFD